MRRINFLLISLLLLTGVGSWAQGVRPTVNHKEDSLAVAEMRARMARIRERRPTVAVVLSGGGAKGAAHVGVLDYLESIGMPVDMVLGTSMGGLVGGLYSLGYSPAFLDTLFRTADWNFILSDRVPRDYISYSDAKYKEVYALSFPFGKKTVDAQRSNNGTLWGSLPSGYVSGQNVSNIFASLSVGYQDDTDFKDLPLPFFCVATDAVTGNAMLWHQGKFNTALRSTMSIPGLFAPVRTNGMVLLDGGMRNNYPTDIARDMGADYVIGVELSDEAQSYDNINNVGDLVWKAIDMLGQDAFEHNVPLADVTVKPDLKGWNMMSFDTASVDSIIHRGYLAALKMAPELLALKDKVGPETKSLNNTSATNIAQTPVLVDMVDFDGLNENDIKYLRRRLTIKEGTRISSTDIEATVAAIYGTGAFNYVTYELLGEAEPYHLVIHCRKAPRHRVGFGSRLDSESIISAIVNVGLNSNALYGDGADFTARIGSNTYLEARYKYNNTHGHTFNMDALFSYTGANLYEMGESLFGINYWKLRQQVYFSNMRWSKYDAKLGIRNEFIDVRSFMDGMPADDSYTRNDYVSAFMSARSDTFDDGYYPSKGSNVGLSANWIFAGLQHEASMLSVSFDASGVIPLARSLSLIPRLNTRCLFMEEHIPIAYTNIVGGRMAGRYLEQQLPFIGINYATACQPLCAVGGLDLRLNVSGNHYVTAVADCLAQDSAVFPLLQNVSLNWGFGLEYGYDSIVGPIRFNVHWSDITEKVGAYLSVGFDF